MAALSESENDIKDLITCSVCTSEFDSQIRLPKFLSCSHTFCLPCLQILAHNSLVIRCPVCRRLDHSVSIQGEIGSLPNNQYVLHLLRSKSGTPSESRPKSSQLLSTTIEDLGELISLKKELELLRESGVRKLNQALGYRKKTHKFFEHMEQLLTKAKADVSSLREKNKSQLDEIQSQLLIETKKESDLSSPLSDLLSLANQFGEQEDTLATLRDKMQKKVELCQSYLEEAGGDAHHWKHLRKSAHVGFLLCDEATPVVIDSCDKISSCLMAYVANEFLERKTAESDESEEEEEGEEQNSQNSTSDQGCDCGGHCDSEEEESSSTEVEKEEDESY